MLLNAFLSEQEFVLVRGCAAPPSPPAPNPRPSPNSTPDEREIEEERKEDHISQSQRCIGDIGTWQPAISHKHLPGLPVPSTSTISSPTLSIDFRLTGVVIANRDLVLCLPAQPCVIPLYVMAVMYVGAISVLAVSGQLLHPLLMELLTRNKLK